MWSFEQATGNLYHTEDNHYEPKLIGVGYSGSGAGKNNPSLQKVANVGPVPVGKYRIGPFYDSPTHGPHVMSLTPFPQNDDFGRWGFLIHGDSVQSPGLASHGCVVVSKVIRQKISDSRDTILEVVSGKSA